jgi:ABC-type branched-subunit amino acid transport system substrate-binding protein
MMDLLKKLGFTKPVVLADDGPTGATLFGPIEEAASAAGLQPAGTVKYALNSTDLSGPIGQIKQSGADSVIAIGSSAADAGLALKTMVEQGVQVPVLGFSSLIAPDALKIGGDAYTKLPAIYTFANMQPSKPQYQEFAKKYATEYNNGQDVTLVEQAGATYDAFMIMDKVLDQTGGKTDGVGLVSALDGMAPLEGVSGRAGCEMSFTEGHSAFKLCLVPFKFENGKPVEQLD